MTTMRQIPLDIRPDPRPDFADFVPGENAEALFQLQHLASTPVAERIYLWGEEGSGRSHLLQATLRASGKASHFVAGEQVADDLPLLQGGLLVVDDVQRLGETAQITLFRTINSAARMGMSLLLAGDAPPMQLMLREDLRTRIGQCLIYQVRPLSDQDKVETLQRRARSRGLRLEPEVIAYLLRHGRRDLGSLLQVLDQIDERTLVEKRPASIPLVREILGAGKA